MRQICVGIGYVKDTFLSQGPVSTRILQEMATIHFTLRAMSEICCLQVVFF